MTGLDTNVVIRFLMQDDPVQSQLATRLFDSFTAEDRGFVSLVTLAETVWVLRSSYNANREHIQKVIGTLLRSRGLKVERSDLVWLALGAYSRGTADFPDYLIERCSTSAGCNYSVTFDRDAVKSAGMKLLK